MLSAIPKPTCIRCMLKYQSAGLFSLVVVVVVVLFFISYFFFGHFFCLFCFVCFCFFAAACRVGQTGKFDLFSQVNGQNQLMFCPKTLKENKLTRREENLTNNLKIKKRISSENCTTCNLGVSEI